MRGAGGIEIWGGAECTVARVGDVYRDESRETGHARRLDDLDRIAGLGIRTLRLPILWETVAGPEPAGWSFHDARLARVRQLGLTPIAGLLHHGSGPPDTSLLDPAFPARLAAHAAAVARRHPDIGHYTPVNEPLTTARFSALYGHWYPHARDEAAFLRALVTQCKGTVLAMRAVRAVRPDAVLVQTEDLGRTFSTPSLAYQAAHDNERRWLSFDLLFGRVDAAHPFHGRLLAAGVDAGDLALFLSGEGAPDILGINHYPTSDRFLDQRLRRYPPESWGGNAYGRFADVDAVRVDLPAPDLGPLARLREAWDRYRRPLAVTEVSHGCTRDEQLRWLMEVWTAAVDARAEGIDVRAVTPWALFGSVDWRTLLTREDGHYEPGAFDVRGPSPRPTAVAGAIASLAATGAWDHPVLDGQPWWRRPERLFAPPARPSHPVADDGARRIVLVGPDDAVRHGVARIAAERGLATAVLDPAAALADGLGQRLGAARAWAVVATGAAPAVALRLAGVCAAAGLPLACLTARQRRGAAAAAEPPVAPGRPAADGLTLDGAEAAVLAAHPGALVARTGFTFGPWGPTAAVRAAIAAEFGAGERGVAISYLPDVAHALLDLLIDGERGVWHLVNVPDGLADPFHALATATGVDLARRDPAHRDRGPAAAPPVGPRPAALPSARAAIAHFVDSRVAPRARPFDGDCGTRAPQAVLN